MEATYYISQHVNPEVFHMEEIPHDCYQESFHIYQINDFSIVMSVNHQIYHSTDCETHNLGCKCFVMMK